MNKYLLNSFWLGLERVASILGSLVVTILVARHLGPANMGVINFSLAISTIVIPICQLGSDNIIFNRTAKKEISGIKLIKATRMLRLTIYLVLSFCIFAICAGRGYSLEELMILGLMMVSSLFVSQDVYKVYFDATLKSKITTLSAMVGLYLSLLLRLLLVKLNAVVVFFTLPFILNSLMAYIIKLLKFQQTTKSVKCDRRERNRYKKYLLNSGMTLTISSLSIVIYTRISQIILAETVDLYSVGIYNAGVTLAQGWSFLPLVLVTSLMTAVISDKQNQNDGFSFLHLISILVSLPILLIFYFFSEEIVLLTFGEAYHSASSILFILSIASLCSVLGNVSYRTIVVRSGFRYLMYKMPVIAVLSITIGLVLIPQFGIQGAAYTVLLTEVLSCTLGNYFFMNGWLLKVQLKVFFSIRYLAHLKSS